MPKFIFITGGVVSSLGKGILSASLAALIQSRGYKVKIKKLDPYLNVDCENMRPSQHGEVFVTEDGAQTDLDLGHYERFTGTNSHKSDSITTGQIYLELLSRERSGKYNGDTVQVIPHVTNLIIEKILFNVNDMDFVIYELGGTVGDIEGLQYLEAIKEFKYIFGQERVMYIHLTLVPYLKCAKELKTKPTQHSVQNLMSVGIQPNMIVCRSDIELSTHDKEKIGLFTNVPKAFVLHALDQDNIYKVPAAYHAQGLDNKVLQFFNCNDAKEPDLNIWTNIVYKLENTQESVNIAIIAKYGSDRDVYKSLNEALIHGGISEQCRINIDWIDSDKFCTDISVNKDNTDNTDNTDDVVEKSDIDNIIILSDSKLYNLLSKADGILIPGGFGKRGTECKMKAIKYARENNIPFFGICLGMQLALIEYARNVIGINAHSTEFFDPMSDDNEYIPVFKSISKSQAALTNEIGQNHNSNMNQFIQSSTSNIFSTSSEFRLGSHKINILKNSLVHKIYNTLSIKERHRNKYIFNSEFKTLLESNNVVFSGISEDEFIEIFELPFCKWFIGVQFHPEFKSRPFDIHCLFSSFIKHAISYKHSRNYTSV